MTKESLVALALQTGRRGGHGAREAEPHFVWRTHLPGDEELRDVVRDRTAGCSFPIVTDMDFGHTAPQFTLPIGCAARIDSEAQIFEVVERAVV